MLKWSDLKFLRNQHLLFPSIIVIVFGHLILINGWIDYVFKSFFDYTYHVEWIDQISTNGRWKVILLYFSSIFLSISVILSRILPAKLLRDYPNFEYFNKCQKDFFSRNPDIDSFLINELNYLERLVPATQRKFRNLYGQIKPDIEDESVNLAQKTKIMRILYLYKDAGLGTPYISFFLFILSFIISIYLSISVFVRVCIEVLRMIGL